MGPHGKRKGLRGHGKRHGKPYVFGTTKVGERGQIVIPKEARNTFNINPGDSLIVLGDENKQGIALVKADLLEGFALQILESIGYFNKDGSGGVAGENDNDDEGESDDS